MATPIQVGQSASITRVFRQEDFDRFAVLSGDDNPIHVDPAFSARTRFGRTVAHGMLLYGTLVGVLGSHLPGPGTVQLVQELMFPTPTYTGEAVTVRVVVTSVDLERGWAELETVVERPGGAVGCQGRTAVCLPAAGAEGARPLAEPQRGVEPPGAPTFKGLVVGQRAETRRTFALADLAAYAELTGDANPLFTDARAARGQGFEGPLVPGSLLGGMFSYLLGTQLPGRGTNYLKQRLVFLAPAYPGEEITAGVEVTRLRPEKNLVNLHTTCTTTQGRLVCDGEALVFVQDVADAA